MLGVVLWSDHSTGKAVIWCEDHGDLAFYDRAEGDRSMSGLDAGDLVEFDVRHDRDLRLAVNPHVVSERLYSGLADKLGSRAGGQTQPDAGPSDMAQLHPGSAQILPFRLPATGRSRDDQQTVRLGYL